MKIVIFGATAAVGHLPICATVTAVAYYKWRQLCWTKIEKAQGMASPDNILLHLPQEEEQQVCEIFARLEEQGFPAQRQTPHITITFSPTMPDDVVQHAAKILPPVIPASLRRVGSVVFGTKRKQTVAWLLETSDELEIAAREISALNPDGRGPRWIPHLTVGLRLPRDIIPEYMRALDMLTSSHLKEFTAVRAALWRPRAQELTVLAGTNMTNEAEPKSRPV